MARVRLADVAEKLGVSEATVSRVLNDRRGVSARTRETVLAALHEGCVVTNRDAAQAMRLIALVTPELTNTLVAALVQELEQAIRQFGYAPAVFVQASDAVPVRESIDLLIERGVAGVLFVSGWPYTTTFSESNLADLRGVQLPFVLVNASDVTGEAPFVSVDQPAAMRMAVRHLSELGHDRIGMVVGHCRHPSSASRVDAFVAALKESRCLDAESGAGRVHHTLSTVEGGRLAAGALLEMGCTGILCESDLAALGVVEALHERRLSVPAHVSVVTFSDSPFMEFTRPPLTAIRQPVESIAMAAVATLLSDVASGGARYRDFTHAPELIVRGSTAARRPMA